MFKLTLFSPTPTAQPVKPSLTPSVKEPTVGDSVILTCTSATSGITSYQFFKDNAQKAFYTTSVGNSHTIASTNLATQDANYTCKAFIDSVGSVFSDPLNFQGKCML